ncbi:MAG: hypothetical protein JWP12_1802 [Bacteroidetes bacterium]|nr:hypothetical protein [Bacteroidota bacterium]
MRIGKLFILLFFVHSILLGQTKYNTAPLTSNLSAKLPPAAANSIKWTAPVKISEIEGEDAKALSFEGADHEHSDQYLPRYSKRVDLRGNENSFTATLINAVYEQLTDAESALISRKSRITNSIVITTHVLTHKKTNSGVASFIPIRKNSTTGKYEKLVSFDLQVTTSYTPKSFTRSRTYAANSVLQSGKWYKIATTTDGIYKISYSFLAGLGINMAAVNPQNLRIYGNGGGMLSEQNSDPRIDDLAENAIYVQGETDGVFDSGDYALFYGTSANTWKYDTSSCTNFTHTSNLYSDSAYYFITFDLGPGKRVSNQSSSSLTPTHFVTTFDDHGFTENNTTNFIKSGREWYGEYFDNIASYNFSYSFPNIDHSAPAYVKVRLASRYQDLSTAINNAYYSVSCQSGSINLGIPEVTGASEDDYANIGNGCFSFNPTSLSTTLTVNVTKQTADALGWMDFVEVNARRQLIMFGTQMAFRDAKSVGAGHVAQYDLTSNTPVQLWDITDPTNIKLQATNLVGTNDYQFVLPADAMHEFVAYTGGGFETPKASGTVANQDLHGMTNKDLIIVAYPDFYDQAMQLASFHEAHDSLSTLIVTPQQIYNEYSSGSQDASAIRDFVKMFYDRSTSTTDMPRYLLLFGDGSYDNKNRFSNNTDFIVTYQSYNSTMSTTSYVSDDFFGLLDDTEGYWEEDDNDAVDIGIGRFPVKSKSEAQTAVNKILAYCKTGLPSTASSNNSSCTQTTSSPFGDWRNVVCFIGDDEDGDLHIVQSNTLATIVDTTYNNYNVDKIFLDSYQQESTPGGNRYPGVTDAINKRVEKGALIINYTGHGGEVGLAHERIVEVSDINRWDNINNMPLFFTATCEFSRFDDPERTSAGEDVFLNPNGGGIALFTTVRLVYASPNFTLNEDFYQTVFTPVAGRMPRLGDLYYYIKTQPGGNSVNSRNFTLLGDPALRLAYPEFNVSTDTLNMALVTSASHDTIKALSVVTVSGFVRSKSGAILTNYNGVLYPTVYDKAQSITTLSNDGVSLSPPYTFKLQKNILYKGKVSVTNGYFKYTFVVPKDIAYQYGIGRISYYAENGTDDASGYYEKIIIGGSNDTATADNVGPEIKLFMNDNKFAFGGMTDENPDLYAVLKDDNGINTVGNGIGHDVTAILDANTENSIVLNDYYQADLNSYKSGSIRYPFNSLSEGHHTLDMKVWDVYNNSSKAYTEFVVAKSASLALDHVLNYPNPFTTRTSFYFEQNQCCQSLEVELQIFTVSGKLVKNFSQFVYAEGYRSAPIEWDGRDDFGDKIGKGVYVYRLKVKTSTGQTAEKYEKLVILN